MLRSGARLRKYGTMEYNGRYRIFDADKIKTHPLAQRANKVKLESLVFPEDALASRDEPDAEAAGLIEQIARAMLTAREKDRAVICFTGAHLIKNGLGPLLADMIERGWVTLAGGNAATAIHDFELALIGETSEHVPNALPEGNFGMAYEFAYLNTALKVADAENLGFGEALGRAIWDEDFRGRIMENLVPPAPEGEKLTFNHPEVSVLARAYRCAVPMTVLAGIGTDVIDQHASFDGRAKGGASGRDFLIYADEATRLAGGVMLNIGSAVTGPEVLLKAISMAANVGAPPTGLTTADFDIRPRCAEHMTDEGRFDYYYRDQKSIVARVPEAFGGAGHYVQGNQIQTFPALYRALHGMARGE